MAALIAGSMAVLNPGCLSIKCSTQNLNSFKPPLKPVSIQLPNHIYHHFESSVDPKQSTYPARSIAITTFFSTLLGPEFPALAAKQIAESPKGDIRGLAIFLPIIPAIAWVLYNILGPTLNQINRMQSEKGNK